MKKVLLVLCFMLAGGTAHAAEWVQYVGNEEFALYYDRSSIETTDENNKLLPVKAVYRTPKKHPNRSAYVKSTISICEINCEKKRYRAIELTLFLEDGSTDSGRTKGQWYDITPEMPVDILRKIICVK